MGLQRDGARLRVVGEFQPLRRHAHRPHDHPGPVQDILLRACHRFAWLDRHFDCTGTYFSRSPGVIPADEIWERRFRVRIVLSENFWTPPEGSALSVWFTDVVLLGGGLALAFAGRNDV